jgi:glutamate---cysteine ligase / carboxylate-amine ligase
MSKLEFAPNPRPTLGVELELQLVDKESLGLCSCIERVLEAIPDELAEFVKPELMQCYIEVNTKVCQSVAEVGDDLNSKMRTLESVVESLGLQMLWAASHPFSSWRDQQITVNARYDRLVSLMEDVARQLVTFGMHVHVGVDTGDKAVMVCDRMLQYLPLLLALSSNSPFWDGRNTGLRSNRSKIIEALPTAGLPYQMRNWSEYVWLVRHLEETGFINTIREIWWDIRPHHNFGTVEIRVCDVPPNMEHVLAITALVQCLVYTISHEIDEGSYFGEYHPMMVAQNKWRATRFGSDAVLIGTRDYKPRTVQAITEMLIERFSSAAEELGCLEHLRRLTEIPANTGSKQQLRILEETGSRREVVRRMIEANRNQY